MKAMDLETMKFQYLDFASRLKTVMLSTLDEEGQPFISYAPFVNQNGKFYIYISKIANHYRHLETNSAVDVMLIEDEASTPNLFARQRARFICTACNLGNDGHEEVFAQFDRQFNKNMMNMLRSLDFSLFELTPSKGRYVAGFGQAFDIDLTADTFLHIARDGHGQSSDK
ncbi:HugZ family pyridoxamine 5'-phosphate oxidase [Paenibacillus aquistagni]|uniref:HugZ family pyridoxamine 5'-phosphate oxidase n=1 Tax=Paenibacillus aquistagni TaxID=1852522 RepID=UPI000B513F05|nr:pyridoxamine 5'-phosphate oxidase family protein [Paenibacillus aquistagni]